MGIYRTKYSGKDITIDYTVESYGSDTTYSPAYGADGGDAVEILIEDVYSDQGKILYNQRQLEKWEETIYMEPPEFDDPEDW
jgi:hypothetical protein